jgi:PLP dependent protein
VTGRPSVPAARREELAEALAAVEQRLTGACRAAGRDRAELTLVAITKTWPAADAAALCELGVRDLGESKDQEASAKAAALSGLEPAPRWHFVGRLQRNKARSVARYADVVHSVDRLPLVAALSDGARRAEREVDVLVQVDLDAEPDPGRGGAAPADAPQIADAVAAAAGLRLAGIMAVAPRPGPQAADPARAFALLAEVAAAVRAAHPGATWISAGMSSDLEAAVAGGATHVRIGTALLGHRPPPSL